MEECAIAIDLYSKLESGEIKEWTIGDEKLGILMKWTALKSF